MAEATLELVSCPLYGFASHSEELRKLHEARSRKHNLDLLDDLALEDARLAGQHLRCTEVLLHVREERNQLVQGQTQELPTPLDVHCGIG